MRFLALDLGTSFLKGAVLELENASISHVIRAPFPPAVEGLPPRHIEVDPQAIVQATQTLLDQLAAAAPDATGIMVTSQMHGIVMTNANGDALTNAVTWQDQRILDPLGSGTYYDELSERITPEAIAATGNGFKPSLPLCTLAWWARQGLLQEGMIPASLPDYVLSTLAHSAPVAEPTMAASMGLLDLPSGQWHQGILRELGLDRLAWPRVIDLSSPAYHIPVGAKQLPCYAPVGDHQCALVGALLRDDELSINISTGSQLGVLVPTFLPGPYETRPYFDRGFLQAITRIPAGRALNALVRLLTELAEAEGYQLRDPWSTIARAVEATPESDMHMEISFFASPVGDRGEMTNLSEDNLSVGHLFRAAFQSMARNYQRCSEFIAPPKPWQQLVFSGGVAQRFEPLRREIATRFSLPYRVSPSSEDTLLGLLALARVAAGATSSVAESVAKLTDEGVVTT